MYLTNIFNKLGINNQTTTAIELKALVETILQIEQMGDDERLLLKTIFNKGPMIVGDNNPTSTRSLIQKNYLVEIVGKNDIGACTGFIACLPIAKLAILIMEEITDEC